MDAMEDYFSRFPGFVYNPKRREELEFERLRQIQGWTPFTLVYKDAYREFLQALYETTGAALDKFFVTEHPNFDYTRSNSPMAEFRRLQRYKDWSENSYVYRRSRKLFETAYDDQFNRAVDGFFNRPEFLKFEYNPRKEAKSEFERLRKFMGWIEAEGENPESGEVENRKWKYREARRGFFKAFTRDFTDYFGRGDSINDWMHLCDILRVSPVPSNIEGCRMALQHFYVNIYNLLDHVQQKNRLHRFADLDALAEYTLKENAIFPLELAEGTCMRFLLRRITLSNGKPGYRYDDWSLSFKPRDDNDQYTVGSLNSFGRPSGWLRDTMLLPG